MIHRIADCHFQCFREFQETLIVRLVACDVVFGSSIGTHNSPLVVVAEVGSVRVLSAQPDFSQISETSVFIDFFRGNVAVIVYQRHLVRIVMEEMLSGFCFQKEVFVHKYFHK